MTRKAPDPSVIHLDRPELGGDGALVFARRPFGYGAEQIEFGQVFRLQGMQNDAKLIRFKLCDDLPKDAQVVECGKCGRRFAGESERQAHGRRAHRFFDQNPLEADRETDEFANRLDKEVPLHIPSAPATIA